MTTNDDTLSMFTGIRTVAGVMDVMQAVAPPSSKLERAALRADLVALLKENGVPTPGQFVDGWFADARADALGDAQGSSITFLDPEPSPDPVDGAEVLRELCAWLDKYVTMPTTTRDMIALWVAFTHGFDCFDICPILAITSATKRCGKTTVMRMLKQTTPRALTTGNISTASVFRVIEKYQPTLLIDEAETYLPANDEMRGVLNAGHTRDSAFVIRQTGPDKEEPRQFSTWAPKSVAAIGNLADTIEDRAVKARLTRRDNAMRAKSPRTKVLRAEGRPLHARLARWVEDVADELEAFDADLVHVNERSEDNWLPLFAIADAAGADWPDRVLAASIALEAEDAEATLGEQLLVAFRGLFDAQTDTSVLPTKDAIDGLAGLETGPWAAMWARDLADLDRARADAARGGSFDAQEAVEKRVYQKLGSRIRKDLKAFGVPPTTTVRAAGLTDPVRGFKREWFEQLWGAYLPPSSTTEKPVTDVTGVTDVSDSPITTSDVTGVTDVTGSNGFVDGEVSPPDDAVADDDEPGWVRIQRELGEHQPDDVEGLDNVFRIVPWVQFEEES